MTNFVYDRVKFVTTYHVGQYELPIHEDDVPDGYIDFRYLTGDAGVDRATLLFFFPDSQKWCVADCPISYVQDNFIYSGAITTDNDWGSNQLLYASDGNENGSGALNQWCNDQLGSGTVDVEISLVASAHMFNFLGVDPRNRIVHIGGAYDPGGQIRTLPGLRHTVAEHPFSDLNRPGDLVVAGNRRSFAQKMVRKTEVPAGIHLQLRQYSDNNMSNEIACITVITGHLVGYSSQMNDYYVAKVTVVVRADSSAGGLSIVEDSLDVICASGEATNWSPSISLTGDSVFFLGADGPVTNNENPTHWTLDANILCTPMPQSGE